MNVKALKKSEGPVICGAIADMGVQLDVIDWAMLRPLKIDGLELLPVSCKISSMVRGSRINKRGGVVLRVLA